MSKTSELPTRIIPMRSEPETSPMFNKPSVEYTGHGNTPCLDVFGGRYFYASEEWVRLGCKKLINFYNGIGDPDSDGNYCNYNTLYDYWGIAPTSFGDKYGWAPGEDYRVDMAFEFAWLGPGTKDYDRFQRPVFAVDPVWDAYPYEFYQEV